MDTEQPVRSTSAPPPILARRLDRAAKAWSLGEDGLHDARGTVARSTDGDGVGRGLKVRALEPDHGYALVTEQARGLEARVAGDHDAAGTRDDRLTPAEGTDGGRDGLDGLVVDAGIGRVEGELVGGNPLNR